MNTSSEKTSVEPITWLNTIDRAIIESGQLEELIDAGVSGVTSAPLAFAHTVQYRSDYNELVHRLDGEGKSPREIMEAIVFDDVQLTADYLHSIFASSEGRNGYVSLDIDPRLQHNHEEIQAEGLRLAFDVDRANVMVQIPATPEGIQAMQALIADGVSVNVTHVYTPETYTAVAHAYLAGIRTFLETLDIWRMSPASVVTVPLHRLNKTIDEMLEQHPNEESRQLRGQIGIAVGREVYGRFRDIFQGTDWDDLAKEGAFLQRPLWANSSTPVYPDTIRSLSPYRLNTYLHHEPSVREPENGREAARVQLNMLADFGIDLAEVERTLQQQALADLEADFARLEEDVLVKRDQLAVM
ncbi:MAG: hypothetical protein KC441_06950 [Anaerolineales bacterium]|nr:hypothetical protein [Anaerolineales bacterium]